MLQGLKDVIALVDPIGEITDMAYRPSGIQLGKMRAAWRDWNDLSSHVPMWRFEAVSLALKSGKRDYPAWGSEALESNKAICSRHSTWSTGFRPAWTRRTGDWHTWPCCCWIPDHHEWVCWRDCTTGGKAWIERISNEARILWSSIWMATAMSLLR